MAATIIKCLVLFTIGISMNIRSQYIFALTIASATVSVCAKEASSASRSLRKQDQEMMPQAEATWLRWGFMDLENLDSLASVPNKETIQVIALHDNKLKNIAASTFKAFPNLINLALNGNKLDNLQPNFLADAKELQVLYLNDNPLKNLNTNALSGLNKLKELNLDNTQLKDLDAFPDLANVETVSCNYNNFEQLNPKVFKKLPKLKSLSLMGNPICDPKNKKYQKDLKDGLPNVAIKF